MSCRVLLIVFALFFFVLLESSPVTRAPSPVHKKVTLTFIFGHHHRLSPATGEFKWKMYMEIDEDEETEDFNADMCIRDVTFSCSNENSYKISHPPFIMEKWVTGLTPNMVIDCQVNFEKSVRRPKVIKYQHTLDPQGTSSGQQVVTLTLQQVEKDQSLECLTPSPNIVHQSQSCSDLKGVWSQRSFLSQHPIPEIKGPVADWSSVVSGRKQSASDLFSVPNIIFPSPKPIPGTPHQLYPSPGSPSLQRFTGSPGPPLSSSGSGSNIQSPWFSEPKSRRASGSSAESWASKHSSQVSENFPSHSSGHLDPMSPAKSAKKRYPSGEQQKEARVTFALSGSESSANTGSEESGFSEKTGKAQGASYAAVCIKCMESMESKPHDEPQRGRGHHSGYQTNRGHQQQGHYQPRPYRGSYRGNQRPQSADTYRRGYQDYHKNENYRGHRGRGQGYRGESGNRGRNRGRLRLQSGHFRGRQFNQGNEYQRSYSDPKPDIEKLTNSLMLEDRARTSSANERHRYSNEQKDSQNNEEHNKGLT